MPIAGILFGLAAAAYAVAAAVILFQRLPGRSNVALAGACAVTAVWAAAAAEQPLPGLFGPAAVLDFFRACAWFGYLVVVAHRTLSLPKRNGGAAFLTLLFAIVAILGAVLTWRAPGPASVGLLVPFGIIARLGLAIGILLLIENLYRNTPDEARWHVNLACIAIVGMYLYEIMLYADTVLYRRVSPLLFTGQAPASLAVLPLLLLAARRQQRWKEDVGVSRSVVFHTATLLLAGIFLVGLAAAGEVFRRFGTGWGMLAEASLMFAGCLAVAVLASSGRVRSQIRGLIVDHFFMHRFDYQHEWTRCITALSGGPYLGLHKRVIRAIADVVDSPAGVLFLAEASNNVFRAAGSWNAPRLDGLPVTPGHPLLDLLRMGDSIAEATPGTAPWFADFPDAWLAVPLPAAGGLVGFIVLAPARAPFRLDREVFDLLGIVGREVALFIGERRATEALVEARQFGEAGRRFAFVAHDIKNVAAQLSLLLGNAEQHLDNPAFRTDMLLTLRGSVQKISSLLARLQSPPAHKGTQRLLAPAHHLETAVGAVGSLGPTPVLLETDGGAALAAIDEATFDAVIRHLIDNALEASPPGIPVRVRLAHEPDRIIIAVIDRGPGMTEDFIRENLFRPFSSTKSAGFGLGAFQARVLLREAGGDLTVESSVGEGTTMCVVLPAASTPQLPAPLALTG